MSDQTTNSSALPIAVNSNEPAAGGAPTVPNGRAKSRFPLTIVSQFFLLGAIIATTDTVGKLQKENERLGLKRESEILTVGIGGYVCGARGIPPEQFIASITNTFNFPAEVEIETETNFPELFGYFTNRVHEPKMGLNRREL